MGKKKKSNKTDKVFDKEEPDGGRDKSEVKIPEVRSQEQNVEEKESTDIAKRSSAKILKSESTTKEAFAQASSKVKLPPEDEQPKALEATESSLKRQKGSSKQSGLVAQGSSKISHDDSSKQKLNATSSKVVFKTDEAIEGAPSKEEIIVEAQLETVEEEDKKDKKKKKEKKEKKDKKEKKEKKPKKEKESGSEQEKSVQSSEKVEAEENEEKKKKKGGKKAKKIKTKVPSATDIKVPSAAKLEAHSSTKIEVPSASKIPSVTKTPSALKPSSKMKMSATELTPRTEWTSKMDMPLSRTKIESHRKLTSSEILLKGESGKSKAKSSKKLKKSSRKLRSSRTFEMTESFDADEFSYSTASSEEVVVKDRKDRRRAPKKEKKPKKKEMKEKSETEVAETPQQPEEEEQDIFKQIAMLKAASMQRAAAAAIPETPEATEEDEEKKKGKEKKKKKLSKKKKVSKKEKARMTAELAEKLRIEAEQEAARLAELERIRLEQEKKEAIEKEKREIVEQQIREEQLEKSFEYIRDVINHFLERSRIEREQSEWQLYLDCRRLPNPSLCVQMNTYLHLWEQVIESTTMEEAANRTKDILQLLGELEDLLDNSFDEDESKKDIWRWVRQLFREHQKDSLDVATYRLLRCVVKNLNRIDIPTADFNYKDNDINLCLWLRVQLPIPLPNPRRPPKPRVDVTFSEIGMQVLLPITIDCENMALRAMYLKYDHLSDLSQTYYMPPTPPIYQLNLQESTEKEWRVRQKYKYDHRDKKPKQPPPEQVDTATSEPAMENTEEEQKGAVEEEPEDFASDEEIPIVPYKKLDPTPSDYATGLEGIAYKDIRKTLALKVPENILNLRKYTILGGVYHLDLLYQPPQPQDFVTIDMTITSLYLPKKLEYVPFSVIYTPPVPAESSVRRLPEEIEEEMKKQEEEMDKLMMVTLTWPQHVIFLELPLVCQWDEAKKHWSKENIHDLKHNEEKCVLSFRTGIFGIFGLAAVRYANLPYQAWEIRPEPDESVTVNVTAAILILEFNVKDGLICISQLQNSPNNALQDVVGIYFKFFKLKRIMKEAGIDVFPEPDAFCYISGSCEKQWPMEKHLYSNMARLSNTFNFAWSRWNFAAGRRKIVLQMREYFPNKPKQKNHSMLLVTPLKSIYIDCTEVSQVFSVEGIENQKFSADLFNLMKATSGIAVRKKVQSVAEENVYALSELLIAVRFLSFS